MSGAWTAQDWLDAGDELIFLRAGVSRQVLRKLRSGTWVIQDQLDLHGLDRHQARATLVHFPRIARSAAPAACASFTARGWDRRTASRC